MAFVDEKYENKCLMCGGNIEKSNIGNVCNECKDKLRTGLKSVQAG